MTIKNRATKWGHANKIALIGFSGSGKSTVGPLLAKALRYTFIDVDKLIERQCMVPTVIIFQTRGEDYFRTLEEEAIAGILRTRESKDVLSIGGGATMNSKTRQVLREDAVMVYLSCSVKELYRRLKTQSDRPLLYVDPKRNETLRQAQLRKISTLLKTRERYYRMANISVSTTQRTPVQVCRSIVEKLEGLHGSNSR